MRRVFTPNLLQVTVASTSPSVDAVADRALLVEVLVVVFVTLDWIEG